MTEQLHYIRIFDVIFPFEIIRFFLKKFHVIYFTGRKISRCSAGVLLVKLLHGNKCTSQYTYMCLLPQCNRCKQVNKFVMVPLQFLNIQIHQKWIAFQCVEKLSNARNRFTYRLIHCVMPRLLNQYVFDDLNVWRMEQSPSGNKNKPFILWLASKTQTGKTLKIVWTKKGYDPRPNMVRCCYSVALL